MGVTTLDTFVIGSTLIKIYSLHEMGGALKQQFYFRNGHFYDYYNQDGILMKIRVTAIDASAELSQR